MSDHEETWVDRVRIGAVAAVVVFLVMRGVAMVRDEFDAGWALPCALLAFITFGFMGREWPKIFSGPGGWWR